MRVGGCANPWYGCLPPTSWLDHWGDSCNGGDLARKWEQVRTALGWLGADWCGVRRHDSTTRCIACSSCLAVASSWHSWR